VLFEKNDIPNACAANATALAEVSADEIELRNQIQYQGQRCPSVATSVASVKPQTVEATAPAQPAPATVVTTPAKASDSTSPAVKPVDSVQVVDTKPAAIEPTRAAPTKTAEPAPKGSKYSVQVAAYNHKVDAQKLASSLVKRGYEARVDGDTIPFRVRIGRYATASEAEKVLAKIKAKRMAGFVVRAPEK
jgi:cell division protein FtsN